MIFMEVLAQFSRGRFGIYIYTHATNHRRFSPQQSMNLLMIIGQTRSWFSSTGFVKPKKSKHGIIMELWHFNYNSTIFIWFYTGRQSTTLRIVADYLFSKRQYVDYGCRWIRPGLLRPREGEQLGVFRWPCREARHVGKLEMSQDVCLGVPKLQNEHSPKHWLLLLALIFTLW